MNKYKRKSKKKTLAMGIGILSSAAVVSTGFAAWIITGGDNVTGTGNITADEVSRQDHNILDFDKSLGDIYFGAPKSTSTDAKWLKNDSEKKEILSVSTTFAVENVQGEFTNTSASLLTIFDNSLDSGTRFEETTTDTDKSYATALKSNYVATLPELKWAEPVSTKPGVYINFTDEDKTTTTKKLFSLNIVFGWGTAFGSENPFDYYNAKDNTKENRDTANTALEALHKVNATFKLTLVTK